MHHFALSINIPRNLLQRAIDNAIAVGLYRAGKQVAFARVVTDRATFAYLADVFLLEPHRGRGLSKPLMRVVMAHHELRSLRRWHLVTRDAHGLYRRFGFWRAKRRLQAYANSCQQYI